MAVQSPLPVEPEETLGILAVCLSEKLVIATPTPFNGFLPNLADVKGFEGELILEDGDTNVNKDAIKTLSINTKWTGVSGTVVLQKPKISNSTVPPLFAVSFTAVILSPENLWKVSQGHNARDQEWRRHQRTVGQRLFGEMKEFGDVIIVDTDDVYRNLVRKLMLFHKWLTKRMDVGFVLKTDDDCFLNIDSIVGELMSLSSDLQDFWWGNFRRQWFVDSHGKWMELEYTADVYPAFACGSGYIIPHAISQWLSQNAHRLHPYQGEDVSMGIYLAAISPAFIDDPRWKCTKDCTRNVLSVPQLLPGEVRKAWKSHNECQNPCGCS